MSICTQSRVPVDRARRIALADRPVEHDVPASRCPCARSDGSEPRCARHLEQRRLRRFGRVRDRRRLRRGGVAGEFPPLAFQAEMTITVRIAITARARRTRRSSRAADGGAAAVSPPSAGTRLVLLAADEARVELVDVELAVEPEVLGVRAEEALDVRLRRAAARTARPRAHAGTCRGSSSRAPPARSRVRGAHGLHGGCCRSRTRPGRSVDRLRRAASRAASGARRTPRARAPPVTPA